MSKSKVTSSKPYIKIFGIKGRMFLVIKIPNVREVGTSENGSTQEKLWLKDVRKAASGRTVERTGRGGQSNWCHDQSTGAVHEFETHETEHGGKLD